MIAATRACLILKNRRMDIIDSDLNPTMAAHKTFDSILRQIQFSNLNFRIQLSPFAANISLKKTPVKDMSGTPLPVKIDAISCDFSAFEVTALSAKNKELENELSALKHEFAEQRDHCETISQELQARTQVKQELSDSKDVTTKLFEKIANLEQENKQLEDVIENQTDEIKNLQAANKTRKEISDKLNKNMNDLKVKYIKEKSEISKKHKAEVKNWRKKLGEETKTKIKLKEQLQDKENNKIDKEATTRKKKLKKNQKSASPLIKEKNNPSSIFCSICSLEIQNYIPEYFCGEKFNPTCQTCKDENNSDDVFSSFSSPHQPPSLASHWLLPLRCPPPQDPSSIPSLISHCVKLPNPEEEKLSDEADRSDFKEWIKEFREQLRADRIMIIEELRKDFSLFKLS